MGIRLHIDLDADGNHTFTWQPCDAVGALEVPMALLRRWQEERDAFTEAQTRWQRVMQEIEDFLVDYRPPRSAHARQALRHPPPQPAQPALGCP